jgi:hypothetical protein
MTSQADLAQFSLSGLAAQTDGAGAAQAQDSRVRHVLANETALFSI